MKKICFALMFVVVFGLIHATANYIVSIPTAILLDKANTNNLREAVTQLSESGVEIYYYNEMQIIAGSANLVYPDARLLSQRGEAKLYLVTKLGTNKDTAIDKCGELILDLGTSVLLKTQLDDVRIREMIDNPFYLLELVPMLLSKNSGINNAITDTRTEIESMIAQVNADSVLYFIQSLQNMQTRYALADNRLTVSNWIKSQFTRFGISNASLHSFPWNNTTQYNVVATITGSVYPDTYIIVGGHHDSITNTTPLVLAPGADDNASGTVAALEMARVMRATGYQPKCSIRFVTFAAEEFGLWGAKAYAQMAQNENLNIRLMVNHDMIANNVSGDLRVRLMPYDGFLDYTDYASTLTAQYTSLQPVYGSMNSGSSDSHPFWAKGFPVIYYFEYNFCPWYHSDQDIVANIDPVYCAEVIRASTAVTATYANMPSAPANLRAWDTGSGNSLMLLWEPSNDPYLDHYKVSYTNLVTQETVVQTTSNNTYQISPLTEGVHYDISVCAVDLDGTESSYAYTSGTPMSVPRTPVNFSAEPFQTAIVLSWNPNTEMDLAGYHVWRSTNVNEFGDLISTVTGDFTTYHDENLPSSLQYYYYRLSAYDSDGNESVSTDALSCRPASMNQGILIVDETKNYNGSNPLQPTDEMVDDFYDTLMQHYNVTTRFDLDDATAPLRLADIGVYSSILWHGNDTADLVNPSAIRDVLREYIYRGGKVFFSVYQPSMAFELNASYPYTTPATSFSRQVLGIVSVNYSNTARFKYAIPSWMSIPYLQVDSLKTSANFNGHIYKVESITPELSGSVVYTYGSDYSSSSQQGVLNGQSIGVYNEYGSGKVFIISFPLYNMEQDTSQLLINRVFGALFSEPSSNDDPHAPVVNGFKVLPNHPNPFSEYTVIPIQSTDKHNPMSVSVYNLKGQLVNTLFHGIPMPENSINWDGKDHNGQAVSSGVYLLKVHQAGITQSTKILRLK